MKLYYSDVLSPRKACAAARYLDVPIDYVFLDLSRGEHQQPDYLSINPNGKVPTLVDGDKVIWEADAVMCYLAMKAQSDFWSRDERQVDVTRWLSWSAQHFTRHAGALYFEYIIRKRFGLGPEDPAMVEESLAGFRRFAAVLDGHLENRDWLVGDAPTAADFAVAVTLPYAEPANMPLDEFSSVAKWHGRLNELEAWRNPFPDADKLAAAGR